MVFPFTARTRRLHPVLAVQLALRGIRRKPGTPFAAALTLGLGFGAAAAIYGVYSGFGGPLPVPDGDVVRWVRVLDERGRELDLTHDDFAALGARASTFEALGGFGAEQVNVAASGRHTERVLAAYFSPELSALLRMAPHRGRLLSPADDASVVIGYDLWIDYLDGEPDVLGEVLRVNGEDHTIVGIMPEGHRFPFNQDAWLPLDPGYEGAVAPVGRLRRGVAATESAAQVEGVLSAQLAERGVRFETLQVEVPGFTDKRGESGEKAALATLLALVAALVLVSCSNVSNLLFARALGRAELLAVHAALGAGPAQVALQMFVESLLIALGGALVGLSLAAAAINYIESTLSGNWGYYWMAVRFDLEVVVFTLAFAVLTGVVSGTLPAERLWRADLNEVLKSDAGGVVGSRRGRFSTVLLNGQVAFSAFALIIAILMAGSLLRARVAEGLRADDVYVAGVALDAPRYDDAARRRVFREALMSSASRADDIGGLAFANVVPGLSTSSSPLQVEGVSRDPDERPAFTLTLSVTPSYFDIFGVRLLAGRRFTAADSAAVPGAAEGVALVSETFVREHLPSADALGRRLRLERFTGDTWLRIVGVVADMPEYADADARELARVYVPFGTVEPRSHYMLYTGAAGATVAVQSAVAGLDADVAVTGVFNNRSGAPVADVIAYVAQLFITVGILAVLGGVGAFVVAVIGLYGALAFEVQRRLGEIGVRMALGAARADVARHMIRAGLWRVAPGLLIAFVLCAGISPLLGFLLGSMNPRDPFIFLGVYAVYIGTTVLAMMVPARRAARLDPVNVLRQD